MRIYNTLTRQKETFSPITPGVVKMYVCGPTVYNLMHIGNARPAVVFDAFRRYLEYRGYQVDYAQNFTDVDDKIIQKAIEEDVDANIIAERFIAEAKKDYAGLGIRPATYQPKATEEIDKMLDLIQTLIDKGYAYAKEGCVYFATRNFKGYGKLSKKDLDALEMGARIEVNDAKADPMDFLLWKAKKPGEPGWPSPFGEGRPGWHIECSAMAKAYLGDTIDIHAGGVDLTFPHHENEIAQSEAANDKAFANYWMHNGFINVDNKKMSKSEGNFFTVRDILESFDYDVMRFFILSAHYRSPINFSKDLMEAAKSSLNRIKTGASNLYFLLEQASGDTLEENELVLIQDLVVFKDRFESAMEDDFNTADAISVLFELVKWCNIHTSGESTEAFLNSVYALMSVMLDLLGIQLPQKPALLDADIMAEIEAREQARKAKDFALADHIRDRLKAQGVLLEDTREGVRFKRL